MRVVLRLTNAAVSRRAHDSGAMGHEARIITGLGARALAFPGRQFSFTSERLPHSLGVA